MRTKRQHRLLQPREQIVEDAVGTHTPDHWLLPPDTGRVASDRDSGGHGRSRHGTAGLLGVDGALANDRLYALSRYGAMGVDVFFGISGFLICSRLIEEHRARGRINLKGFYIRRFFRILPPYFALLTSLALLSAVGVFAISGGELLSSVLFLRNYFAPAAPGGWYTGHLWSLAVEEHFYLLWPGLLVLWGVRRARWGCAALSLLLAAWRVAEFRLQIGETLIPGLGFYTRTDIRLDALLWDCWFALMVSDPHTRERLARLLSVPVWLGALGAPVTAGRR
jgi:peptidoglycan/LPS O-acetylase OafA/YrhL